jgi:ABC-type Fe3+/spermidine/putrescine transport system ATPase subunit
MVFQNYAIFQHLTVFENVAFPLRSRGVDRKEIAPRVKEALETVKLTGLEGRFRRQLSGGQQQRVALARAIVAHPSIVLMDEPLGALDKNLRYHMQTEIKDIQRRLGMTVLFVTHDQEEAMALSDRIAILDGGRVVQSGPPRAVYEQPETEFVARFLGEANLLEGVASGPTLTTAAGTALRAQNALSGAAKLFVRPEKLTLADPALPSAPGDNRLRGRVRRVMFLGTVVRTELDVEGGHTLLVDQVNGPQVRLFDEGEPALASWPVASSRLLPG